MPDESEPDGCPGRPRIEALDASRGLAIALMVAYHLLFDLRYLGIADVDPGWKGMVLLQIVVGTMFIAIAGISMGLSQKAGGRSRERHLKRALRLALAALLITTVTWVYPHQGFIRFGIIHLLSASTLIAIPLASNRIGALIAGSLLLAVGLAIGGMPSGNEWLFWIGLVHPSYHALDHYPILPWTGVFLIGLAAAEEAGKRLARIRLGFLGRDALIWAGRNSLIIYLVHQPILIGALLALGTLFAVR